MEIEGYNNYLIYDDGRVYNKKKQKFLKAYQCGDYLGLRLCDGGKKQKFQIHRLVALHYIPNPENKSEVNHIDGDKFNNDITNLEWMTRKENMNAFRKIQTNNTSGVKNISYQKHSNGWIYQKRHYGKNHSKYFKTFEEACEYKRNFETTLS